MHPCCSPLYFSETGSLTDPEAHCFSSRLARKPQQFSRLYPLPLRDEVIVASSHIFVDSGDPSPGPHDYAQ